MTEQQKSRPPHRFKFLDQSGKRQLIEPRVSNVIVLLKPFHRRTVSTADSERAIRENTFRVNHVAQHFFDRPLVRRVPKPGAISLIPESKATVSRICRSKVARMSALSTNEVYRS